jgi:general secretion pathway protein G
MRDFVIGKLRRDLQDRAAARASSKLPITSSISSPINSPINFPINYPITRLSNYPILRPIRMFESGFTMIELLIVVTLIIILSTMGMTQYRAGVIHAREATLKEDLFRLRDAIDQYYADKGQYPSALDALVSDGYIRKLPEDPFTRSADTWQEVPAEPDPNNPVAEPGIQDVKSGSDATALDGSKYADW